MISSTELTSISLKTLVNLSASARGLTLYPKTIRNKQSGGYISRFKGRGMEFDETRLYQAGDDIRSIDWRVTARTSKTHTKIFREERERPVFISIDLRTPMHFATRGVFKSVLASKLAALIAWSAHYHGDRIGGQLFSDSQCVELKPQNGRRSVLHFLNALIQTDTHSVDSSKYENLETILNRLSHHTHTGSLLYLISDFRGLTPNAQNSLIKLARHCDIVLLFIYDELEQHLPSTGQYRFIHQNKEIIITASLKQQLEHQQHFESKQELLKALAKEHRMIFLPLSTQANPIVGLRFTK